MKRKNILTSMDHLKSTAYRIAEAMGITPESLRTYLMEEIVQDAYPIEDTRVGTFGNLKTDS